MKMTQLGKQRRTGFTLIELLVVIAIIVVLIGLMLPAIFRAMEQVKNVQARAEISQLAAGLEAFKSNRGVDYIPATLNLASSSDAETSKFLTRCWPRINIISTMSSGNWPRSTLQGYQVMVFLLGGNQKTVGTVRVVEGFSTDPSNPSAAGGARIGPFYDFKPERLAGTHTAGFYYLDCYGLNQPYMFFSSGILPNGYAAGAVTPPGSSTAVAPYRVDNTRFWKPDSYQIICAGINGQFGPGGVWSPSPPPQTYARGTNGYDDLSNIYENRLGIAPQQ
jgi:prepilin-type N-terminal cleavage/methylation domain-containing protein